MQLMPSLPDKIVIIWVIQAKEAKLILKVTKRRKVIAKKMAIKDKIYQEDLIIVVIPLQILIMTTFIKFWTKMWYKN